MTAVVSNPPEQGSPKKARRYSFLSFGRGGSGNIRRLSSPKESERTLQVEPSVTPPRGRQSTSNSEKFFSSGRGGSGNIQPSSSPDLENYPFIAAIVSQYSAVQTQYEDLIRKVHAESSVVHSSGRGGSGNISDQRRTHTNETSSINGFFNKGRVKGTKRPDSEGPAIVRDRPLVDRVRRQSDTVVSGSSVDLGHAARPSNILLSSVLAIPTNSKDPLPSADLALPSKKRQGFMIRWSRPPQSIIPINQDVAKSHQSPRSRPKLSSFIPGRAIHSMSVVSEGREYTSFLDF